MLRFFAFGKEENYKKIKLFKKTGCKNARFLSLYMRGVLREIPAVFF
jgi:hypothetical protein